MRKKPQGFVATCQCGVITGAMDAERTDNKDAGRILGGWLSKGCTVTPQFEGTWSAHIQPCQCDQCAARPLQGEK